MRPAPGYHKHGDSIDGQWKVDLLRWLGTQVARLDTFVETGTCHAHTVYNLHVDFKQLFTIELHDGLYEFSKNRLAQCPNVKLYHGSTKQLLEPILKNDVPPGPALFWLDAHNSGPQTADDGDPLTVELEVVMRLRPDSLIVIDDMPNETLEHTGLDFTGWTRLWRTGEVILFKDGLYNIPELETV